MRVLVVWDWVEIGSYLYSERGGYMNYRESAQMNKHKCPTIFDRTGKLSNVNEYYK